MHYYILFNNYEEALAAREVLSEGNVERARECLDAHHTFYHSIVAYDGGLNPKRDRYC